MAAAGQTVRSSAHHDGVAACGPTPVFEGSRGQGPPAAAARSAQAMAEGDTDSELLRLFHVCVLRQMFRDKRGIELPTDDLRFPPFRDDEGLPFVDRICIAATRPFGTSL